MFVNKALSQHSRPLSPSAADCQNDGFGSLCFYRPRKKFAMVMFSQTSVILSTGGCLRPGRSAARGGWVDPPSIGYYGIRSASGRYAPYWNAFLLLAPFWPVFEIFQYCCIMQQWIQDFPQGTPTRMRCQLIFLAKKCSKMQENWTGRPKRST